MSGSLLEQSSRLEDPRIDCHKCDELLDIIVFRVWAVVGGAEGWKAIEALGRAKLPWLRRFVPLANGWLL